jgi:hypothetical protein
MCRFLPRDDVSEVFTPGVTGMRATGPNAFRMRRVLPVLLLLSLAPAPPSGAAAEDRTPNLTVEARLPYAGGTELATDGRYVYAGQWNGRFDRDELPKQGGVRIFDSQATPPKLVGTISCPGTDNDVAVVRPGILAIAHHRGSCGVSKNGIVVFDVSNPAKPKKLSSIAVASAHTLTAVPDTNLVYVSPGGLGNGQGVTTVVDLTDATHPKIRARIKPDRDGCHDVTFSKTLTGKTLGVCTGWSGVRIWDMTNPLLPRTLSFVEAWGDGTTDEIQFPHGSAISPDGTLLVVNDEAFLYHRCDAGDDTEAGSLHLYDITDPAKPAFIGRIVPPRGAVAESGYHVNTWCTSHQLNFAPNSRRLVNAWFTGGVSVWDLTVPSQPREEAHYVGSGAVTWTAHWMNGRIWVNDMARGVEVLRLSALPVGGPVVSPAWRPASTVPRLRFSRPARPVNGFVCPA